MREARARALNADARTAGDNGITWTGRNVQISLANSSELITGGYNLAPYKYVSASNSWTVRTPQELLQTIEERYPLTDDNVNFVPIVTG